MSDELRQRLERALVKADAAGDVTSARAFAAELKKLQPQPVQEQVQPKQERTLGGALTEGFLNIPSSAEQFAGDIVSGVAGAPAALWQLAQDPAGLTRLIAGTGERLKSRYGGEQETLATIATDPVGTLADIATPFTLGGAGLAKAGGAIGKVGQAAAKVGEYADPLVMAGKAAKGAGLGLAEIGGLRTGKGSKAIKEAAGAGLEGGAKAEAFKGQLREQAPMLDILEQAKAGVSDLYAQRSQAYQREMAKLGQQPQRLDMTPILQAVDDVRGRGKTQSGKLVEPSAVDAIEQAESAVLEWANDPAAQTALELDGLKRRLYDIEKSQSPGSNAASAVAKIRQAVKSEIVRQDPTYAKTMGDYELAAEHIQELEKALSLSDRASADTAMRKLLSVMRDNVNTNFGQREQLLRSIDKDGTLMPAIAGATLKEWTPGGLARIQGGGNILAGGAGYAATGSLPAAVGIGTLSAASQSPRLWGEAAYGLGALARYPSRAIEATAKALEAQGINPRVAALMAYQMNQAQEQPQTLQELGAR